MHNFLLNDKYSKKIQFILEKYHLKLQCIPAICAEKCSMSFRCETVTYCPVRDTYSVVPLRGGGEGVALPGHFFFIFMQFLGTIGQVIDWRPQELAQSV